MNIEVPQTYAYLHFLTPFCLDTIEHDPWDKGHAWHEKGLKKGEPREAIRRRPLAMMDPAWANLLGSEDDKRDETLYMLTQAAYTEAMMLSRLTGDEPDFVKMRTHLAAFMVLRGFILNKRHTWDWSLLPDDIRAAIPTDTAGPA